MKRFSLSRRLVGYLLIGQIVVYFLTWILHIPLSLTGVRVDLDLIANELAENRARAQVAASLRRGADGVARIEPAPGLRQLLQQNLKLKFAAFDLQLENALPGSSPDLVERMKRLGSIQPYAMNFKLADETASDLRGALTKEDTSVGRVIIVTYGYTLHWDDLVYFVRDNARDNFIYFIPVSIAAALIAWLAVKRGLAPLHTAAAYAQRIDMNSLEQRIPLDGIPGETLPLVEAVNAALARLDAGAARQRRFAANAAHEMRTPVAILRTRVDALDDEAPFKTNLKRDVRRIQNIVEQLLIAARLGEQSAPMNERVDAAATIRSMVADYAPLVIENHRNIEFDSSGARLIVVGNRRAIECAVANLIDNALRAEPIGGSVIVRVEPGVKISVIDHGEGVPPAALEMIFEPFWRGSEATPGTGLGLAIVKELVDLHRGTISLEQTPGGGSTFVIILPQNIA